MITPLDIENKTFNKQIMSGYSIEEVQAFMSELLRDYEKLYKENIEYKLVSFPNYDSPSSSLVKMYLSGEFGKNAILKGMNLEEHGTTRERNHQIGGHKSGV